jgi:hypothetical protein
VAGDPKGTLVFSKSPALRFLHIALFSAILAGCSNDDTPAAQTSASASAAPAAPSIEPQSSAAVDSSSDIQRWAALQTQPVAAAQQAAAPAPASDALLPPVIHTVD